MKRHVSLYALPAAVLTMTLASCERSPSVAPEEQQTYTELRWVGTDAVYQEGEGKRDVSIIFFMAEWCGWCSRMKKESLSDSTVIQILGESYNIAWINPEADSLVVCGDSTVTCRQMTNDVFGVRGFPSMAFCKRSGELIGMAPGYKTVAAFIDILEEMRDGEY